MKRLLAIALICAGCGSLSVGSPALSGPATDAQTTDQPLATEAAAPTPSSTVDNLRRSGEAILILEGDEDWANITVDQVKQRLRYAGEYVDDEPATGNIYIEMFVTYEALAENVRYGSFDWDLFADDVAVDTFTFLSNGPEPDLRSGALPKGRKAQGWLVYEIPKEGRVVLSYKGNVFADEPPIFEIVLRNE